MRPPATPQTAIDATSLALLAELQEWNAEPARRLDAVNIGRNDLPDSGEGREERHQRRPVTGTR